MHAKPRAYEPHRLVAVFHAQSRVLITVAVAALFGGAALAPLVVPDWQLARAAARIGFEPQAVLANHEALLVAAAARVGMDERAAAPTRQSLRGEDQLFVEVRAPEAEQARALADALIDGAVAFANARAEARHALSPETTSQVARVTTTEPLSRVGMRVWMSLLAPVLAVLLTVLLLLARELRNLRVCEATELAHWLRVPVLTTSAWPRRRDALDALVDALADPALESLGTTLVLPFSEVERPLAYTLTARLNARARRHISSDTGALVVIAQEWRGELDSEQIARAAEVADRVLWVVAADSHHGKQLEARRTVVGREQGVAAVLVDAGDTLVRSIGASDTFWTSRASDPGLGAAAPAQ